MSDFFTRLHARSCGSPGALRAPAPFMGGPGLLEEVVEERTAGRPTVRTTTTHPALSPVRAAVPGTPTRPAAPVHEPNAVSHRPPPVEPPALAVTQPERVTRPIERVVERHENLAPPRAAPHTVERVEERRETVRVEHTEHTVRVERSLEPREQAFAGRVEHTNRAAAQREPTGLVPPSATIPQRLGSPPPAVARPVAAPAAPTPVEVNIGEIVVRATRPPATPPRTRAPAAAPRVSLASYLAGRKRR